jgi:hypothetical protein
MKLEEAGKIVDYSTTLYCCKLLQFATKGSILISIIKKGSTLMNATTETVNTSHNGIDYTFTYKKVLGLYGLQANEWHVIAVRETFRSDKDGVSTSVNAWCNNRAKPHTLQDVEPTTENVTCDKCLKYLNRAAK